MIFAAVMPALTRLFSSLRSFDRQEMVLQGAFLVGLTSLVILVGQTVRTEPKEPPPVERPMQTAPQDRHPVR